MNHDRNLLFGALALQAELISADQFAEACQLWTNRPSSSLPDILCAQGWMLHADLMHVDYLVERKLARFAGDVRASLADCSGEARSVLASLVLEIADTGTAGILPTLDEDDATSSRDDPKPIPSMTSPDDTGPRYTLNSLHAAGGIGEIWLARDAHLQRDVAVKRLQSNKSASEVAKKRFLREARITGQLDHPGVVPIYEICLDALTGAPYYSMRFLKGRTLSEAVRAYHHHQRSTHGGASQQFIELLNAFCIVCNTVAYAHSKGVVHRDLKCDNIILGDFGDVVVIDWGLAKEVDSFEVSEDSPTDPHALESTHPAATLAGQVIGTPAYMAPEQAAGRLDQIGPHTDVYGLCAILYEILCGVPPFMATNAREALHKVQNEPPVPPSGIVAKIPKKLEQICLQGLAKSPRERHASADRLAREVQGWLSELAERRKSEEERERFFALSLDLLAILDDHGRLQQASPAWERFLGHPRDAITGGPLLELIHGDDRSMVSRQLAVAHDGQPVHPFEARAIHRDGSPRWLSWNVTPIPSERSLYIVGRDITELKQSQQLFEGVMQSAPDAMILVDRRGTMVMVNRQAERIFGYTTEEMLGKPIEMLIPARFRQSHPEKVAQFFATSSVRPMGSGIPLKGLHRDGSEFPAEIALSPITTEASSLVAASIRDVSHWEKANDRDSEQNP